MSLLCGGLQTFTRYGGNKWSSVCGEHEIFPPLSKVRRSGNEAHTDICLRALSCNMAINEHCLLSFADLSATSFHT